MVGGIYLIKECKWRPCSSYFPLFGQCKIRTIASVKNMEAICVIYMNEVSGNYIQTSSGKCMAENLKGKINEQL